MEHESSRLKAARVDSVAYTRPSQLESFLYLARRHWTVWTIIEHGGLGLLSGCCCVLLLLPILLWRAQPGAMVAVIFPLLGAVVGAIAGFRRRPGLRDVARLADDRFQTADLLATALALRGASDPWHVNILKMADACVAGISPALLTPHRLGRRTWSGIALALVASITLGLFSITTSLDCAEAGAPLAATDARREWQNNGDRSLEAIQTAAPPAIEASAETTSDSHSTQDGVAASQDGGAIEKFNRSVREGQADKGAGEGSARTDSSNAVMPNEHSASFSGASVVHGTIAAGGQGRGVHARSADGATAGTVSADLHNSVTPWSSSGWPTARAAALGAVQDGRVPDACRDLVRDYFQNRFDQIDESQGR